MEERGRRRWVSLLVLALAVLVVVGAAFVGARMLLGEGPTGIYDGPDGSGYERIPSNENVF